MKYVKYLGWTLIGAFFLWVLYVIAGLGSPWLSVGIVGFVAFIALFNRMTSKPSHKVGRPHEKRRVTSTDLDRWGGGGSL